MIGDLIGEWIKGILIDGIMGNLSGLFNTVNTKVGEIASDVGSTPQDWNGGIFSMLQNLSETVIVPIAAAILALVMCYELIDMIVEKNNMHDFDSSMFFRWIFKSAFAILIVTNTWNIVMGGKNGLEAIEKTVIDRAVQVIYRPYLADPRPENMPILSDLHQALLDQHIPEADRVAQALDLYVNGSLNVFNHRTNVNIENRIVAFDIKELGKQLKKLGMLIVQDQIWGRVTQNRSQGKATWYFCDEFHLLLREEQTAAFSCEIWKRFRKWGGIPTGATQNVKVRPDRALCKAV